MLKTCGLKTAADSAARSNMSGAAREPDQADFDLERFIDMFDTALTSNDPRVVETLRKLLMIVALTKPETDNSGLHDRNAGPLRRLYDDVHHLNRKIDRLEEEVDRALRSAQRSWEQKEYDWDDYQKYTLQAAKQMAVKMDQGIMDQLTKKINSPIKGLK